MTPTINLSHYKLLAFDLDGTLIGSDKQISAYTKTVLSRLRACGVLSTIASGRILPAVKAYADELDIDIPLILSNGSILQNRRGELSACTSLPVDVVQATIETARRLSRDLVIYICDNIYIERMTDNIHPTYGSMTHGLNVVGNWEAIAEKLTGVNKCVIVDQINEQNLIDTETELRKTLNGRAVTLRTSPVLLEVQPKGITKATGLRQLTESLSISLDQVIAFGDYDNDAEMLQAAGMGVAVGNATPACLENADLQVASPEEDGPARFLDELIGR